MLRNGIELSPQYEGMVKNLNSALEKSPKYQGRITRSIKSCDKNEFNQFIRGHDIESITDYKISFIYYLL